MPKYQITAPDGRIVVVEGTKPPTEQDAAAIFAQIGSQKTQEPEQSPYSPMEQVKYTLRAAGEAAPFGMGDLTAGYVATQARNVADVTHGKDLKTRLEGAKRFIDYATPIGQIKMLKEGTFGKERADFIKEQEDFAKHHGGLNFLGEMVGGALTGGVGAAKNVIGKQGIKALMGAGAREGGKFGLYYGAGSGFTQDTDKLSVYDALKGAGAGLVGGAVVGGALPPVAMVAGKALGAGVKGAKAIGGKIAKILKKDAAEANQALGNAGYLATDLAPENKVFLNLLEANPEGTMEAVKAGEPLVAHANRKQLRRTRGAVTADEGADQTFIEAKRAFDQGKIQKGEDISDRLLSKESGYTATERIADEAHNKYKPLYEEVMKAGEIELPQEIIANETILGAIQEAQGRAGYTKLKANNVRVLDKAKRVLQDKFKSLQRAGKNDEAREYQLAKEELVNFMDRKLPQYAEARKAFMEGQELQEFVDLGRKLKNISHAEVERIAKTLTPEQQQALKAGIGDSVRESLYNTRSEGTNVLDKAFPAPLRRKMQALGIKDEEIANEIAKEIQTNANYQFIGGGSNTMNKAYDAESVGKLGPIVRTIKAIKSPLTTLEKAADKLDNKLAGLDSEEIARLMFNAEALAKEAKKPEHQRRIAEILRKSKQDKSGQSIAGYLGGKLKEKGGYAMKDLPEQYTISPKLYENIMDVHIKAGKVENAPKKWHGQTIEEAKEALGFAGKKSVLIKTPIEDIRINEGHLQHLLFENAANRKEKLFYAVGALKNPNLITKTNERGHDYHNYIKLYKENNSHISHLQIVKVKDDGSFYVTNFEPTKKQLEKKIKEGQIVYDLSDVSSRTSTKPNTEDIPAISSISSTDINSIGKKEGKVKGHSVAKILKNKESK